MKRTDLGVKSITPYGDSAGGNLALALSLVLLHSQPERLPFSQVILYPMVDVRSTGAFLVFAITSLAHVVLLLKPLPSPHNPSY